MFRIIRACCAVLLVIALAAGAAGCSFSREPAPDFSGKPEAVSAGSPVKHYFEMLDDTEKHAYNAILSEVHTFPQRIAVPTLNSAQLNHIYTALLYDNPELFFLERTSSVQQSKQWAYFYPKYRMGITDYEAMLEKCAAVADKIAQEAAQKETLFDKELIVHDRLLAMCRYSDNSAYAYRNSIYGVLCNGNAACEGYAKAAKYVLDRIGIPCYLVTGQSTPPGSASQSHMWNIVQLDGKFYHLDLTWDDPVLENGENLIRHTFFNVTDSVISATHSGYSGADACTAIDDNYFVHEHLLFADWGEAERQRTVDIAVAGISAGSEGFQLRFGNKTAYDKAKSDLFAQNGMAALLQMIRDKYEMVYAVDHTSYVPDDKNYLIDVILEK